MNIMKFRRPSHNYAMSSFFDDFFNNDLLEIGRNNFSMTRKPFTNIIENDDDYIIELAIPGVKKDDVDIKVEKDQLIISSVREETSEEEDNDKNYTKREFNYSSFRQAFHLPEVIDSEKISASYEDGILKVKLDKKETSVEKAPRSISIK